MTQLVAEYEFIREDGSRTTTRYLPIPDDLTAGAIRDWVADRIVPLAEEGGYAEWDQRIVTSEESARLARQRVAEVLATRADFRDAIRKALLRKGLVPHGEVRDVDLVIMSAPGPEALVVAVTSETVRVAYIMRPTVPGRPSLGDGKLSVVQFRPQDRFSNIAANIAEILRQCRPADAAQRRQVMNVALAEHLPAADAIDDADLEVIKAAYRGQLDWRIEDGASGFWYRLGPKAGQPAGDDVTARIRWMVAAELLAVDETRGYSSVEITPKAYKLPLG